MQSLHERIMAAVANKAKEDNNVRQDSTHKQEKPKPRSFFRMSSTYATAMSTALLSQLDRYCEAERKTRSRAIRNAVYEFMENPSRISAAPANLPTIGQPPDRNCVVSWTMPSNKPEHVEQLHNLCPSRGSQSNLVRRAVYRLTQQYRSTDPDEHKIAMRDAWF